MRIWKFPDQVIRLSIIAIVALIGLLILRQKYIPESFGKEGHYRAEAITAVLAQPIRYAGSQACADCHGDVVETKNASFHRGLACEVCHGPAADHVNEPDRFKPQIPSKRAQCAICHNYLISRPTGFPQINEPQHNPNMDCMNCHNPHDPVPPSIPESCSACHATIARTKAVSYHAILECEVCHQTKPEHKENPRAFAPTKPTDRNFCGKCHSPEAQSAKNIPRVDIQEHGGRYLCWQCHYPHFPEAY